MPGQLPSMLKVISTLLSAVTMVLNPQYGMKDLLTVPGEIKKAGYPVELHSVTTEDGYILGVHRIPYSPKSPDHRNKSAVLLQHGLFTCSGDWISTGPDKAFAYMLADLGYDVWMGNSRGNTYSRKHKTLNPNKGKAFWNFSWHEMGIYDLPATIDYILERTGQQKLFYVGHSQGTTQFYVMASERPEYNDKIRAHFSFAPSVTQAYSNSPMTQMGKALNLAPEQFEGLLGIREMLRQDPMFVNLIHLVYQQSRVIQIMAETSLYIAVGFDWEQVDGKTVFPTYAKLSPAGASTKQLYHYGQGAQGKFSHYDYGQQGNLQRYGTEQPPEYNMSKITCPVALHHGPSDWMSSQRVVDELYDKLPNPIGKFVISYPYFNHIDYLFAKDVKELLYNKVVDLMKSY